MHKPKVKIDTDALFDIKEATDWYNEQLSGLGSGFQKQVKQQINYLKVNAENYSIRYNEVVRNQIGHTRIFKIHT